MRHAKQCCDKKLIDLNDFKSNLNVLVSFGSRGKSGLKVLEHAALEPSTTAESEFQESTTQLIRATSCVPGADEKSGYGLLFTTYLQSLDSPVTSKLHVHSFLGHRINIIRSCVFPPQTNRSFQKYSADEQKEKLILAVESYIKTPVYMAGCRTLSIIDKLVTSPIWRQIEAVKHILDLNPM